MSRPQIELDTTLAVSFPKYIDETTCVMIILRVLFFVFIQGRYATQTSTELLVHDKGITRIGDLQKFTSLRKLDVSFNPIATLEHMDALPKLTHLQAYSCLLEDLDALDE